MKTLKTRRLVLRTIHPQDFYDFAAYYSDAEVAHWLLGQPATDGLIQKAFNFNMRPDVLCYSVVREGRVIGNIHFVNIAENYVAEMGYVLCPKHQGQGLMTEAMAAAVDYGFYGLGFGRLRAVTQIENTASIALLARLGFEHEATIYEASYGGRVADVAYYSLLGEKA